MIAARLRLGAVLGAAAICASAGAAALPATALADAAPAEVIAAVNAVRAADGFPAGIVENPDWSHGCALHDQYRRLNGIAATGHGETAGLPGYTPEGEAAGASSILATTSWSAGNPFATAPIHLMQLLDPRIRTMGADDAAGLVCVSTFRGEGPVAPSDVLYASPGDGRRDVPVAEEAHETPFVPAELLAVPPPPLTGPHILVLADGPFTEGGPMRIVSAGLQGPAGPVEVRTLDETEARIAPFIPPGGMVIPVAPLSGGTSYTASVVLEGADGVRLERTWSFRTEGPADAPEFAAAATPGLTTGVVRLQVEVHGRRLLVRGPLMLTGRTVTVAVTRKGATRRREMRLTPSASLALRRREARSGTRIAVSCDGFVESGVRWRIAPVRTTVARARR